MKSSHWGEMKGKSYFERERCVPEKSPDIATGRFLEEVGCLGRGLRPSAKPLSGGDLTGDKGYDEGWEAWTNQYETLLTWLKSLNCTDECTVVHPNLPMIEVSTYGPFHKL